MQKNPPRASIQGKQEGQNLVQNFVLYTPLIHLVSAGKQRLRHGEAERGLEVSYERVRSATAAAAPPGHVSWTVSADHPDFHRRLAPGTAARPIAIRGNCHRVGLTTALAVPPRAVIFAARYCGGQTANLKVAREG